MQLVCFLKNQLNSIERLVQKRFPWWDLIVLEEHGSKLPTGMEESREK